MIGTQRSVLAGRAQAVLDRNRRGAWTCPAKGLYPHQWLWDSCFIAIGLASEDPQRAADELRALLRGQWADGMLPHMIFARGGQNLGRRNLWRSKRNRQAPRDIETSCITQPPLLAIAGQRVAQHLQAAERTAFLDELVPKVLAYHRWCYQARDPHQRGLVTLIHPWECGLDTTPPWMEELAHMHLPWWVRATMRLHLSRIVRLFRRDTKFVPAGERPSNDDGFRMLVLATHAKRYGFELARMPELGSVLIEDLTFNSLLVVANDALLELARKIDLTVEPELLTRFDQTKAALEQLWDERTGQYYSRNAVSGALLPIPTVATFLPLWAGTPSPARAARLVAALQSPSTFRPRFPVPSVPTDSPHFDPERYWKGPTWINMNWMIVQGLRASGEPELADEIRLRTLALVDQHGFSEYFSPLAGVGYGADDFSWTAALVLELLDESQSTNQPEV